MMIIIIFPEICLTLFKIYTFAVKPIKRFLLSHFHLAHTKKKYLEDIFAKIWQTVLVENLKQKSCLTALK